MKNQILITIDSLRWDVFQKADAPFLKSLGIWKEAETQATYTFPAHMSFFVGKLPQTFDDTDYYDTVATRIGKSGRAKRNFQLWRLTNPEAPREARHALSGANIVEGFRNIGYRTIGTGAMNWFNDKLMAGQYMADPFEHYRFFEQPKGKEHQCAEEQISWVADKIDEEKSPYFLFINLGETHHLFKFKNCEWSDDLSNPYGDADKCLMRQRKCLEYLDAQLKSLWNHINDYELVICSDHGEAMGEDGLWGHGFSHETVMKVPLLIKADDVKPLERIREGSGRIARGIKRRL